MTEQDGTILNLNTIESFRTKYTGFIDYTTGTFSQSQINSGVLLNINSVNSNGVFYVYFIRPLSSVTSDITNCSRYGYGMKQGGSNFSPLGVNSGSTGYISVSSVSGGLQFAKVSSVTIPNVTYSYSLWIFSDGRGNT